MQQLSTKVFIGLIIIARWNGWLRGRRVRRAHDDLAENGKFERQLLLSHLLCSINIIVHTQTTLGVRHSLPYLVQVQTHLRIDR